SQHGLQVARSCRQFRVRRQDQGDIERFSDGGEAKNEQGHDQKRPEYEAEERAWPAAYLDQFLADLRDDARDRLGDAVDEVHHAAGLEVRRASSSSRESKLRATQVGQ